MLEVIFHQICHCSPEQQNKVWKSWHPSRKPNETKAFLSFQKIIQHRTVLKEACNIEENLIFVKRLQRCIHDPFKYLRQRMRKQLTAVSRYLFSQSALSYTFERLLNTLEWCHCSNNRNDYSKGFRKYVIFLIQYLLFFNFTDAFQGWN